MARAAYRQAIPHLEQALEIVQRLPKTREWAERTIDIHLDIRNASLTLGDRARVTEHLHQAELLARTIGDQHRLGRIAAFMVIQCLRAGHFDQGVSFGQEALTIARTLGDRPLEVVATSFLGMTHAARGEFSDAQPLFERNVVLEGRFRSERFGAPFVQSVLSGSLLATILSQLGRFDEGIAQAEAALHTAEAADHPLSLYTALNNLGYAHLRRGDLARATLLLERGLDLCRAWQFAPWTPIVAAALANAHALGGRTNEAIQLVSGVAKRFLTDQLFDPPGRSLLCSAVVYLLAGQVDEAGRQARDLLAFSRKAGARGTEAEALHLAGDIASATGATDAEDCYGAALALAEPRGMRPLIAHCHLGLSTLYRRESKSEKAREHLATATSMYREMAMGFWLEKAQTG
jgi:tetratricopeptide (TPR) repeat protein